ncbi:MAG TPA: DNA cytosine methyltransferase [Caulobacteraceae bacterium]
MGSQRLRAIDLYSGVGGWSCGLAMADLDVVASFEHWPVANKTNRHNNRHSTYTVDIRTLPVSQLPRNIDVVVGSPPCTEFSYSNRGGAGDLKDGLKDIVAFLGIVDFLRPRWWVMENVPRAADVVAKELGHRGKLARFRHLGVQSIVLNAEDYGLPQRRRRALIGNINFDLLKSYCGVLESHTLGDVIAGLGSSPAVDPHYGLSCERSALIDHDIEAFLDDEEVRINEAAKAYHPIYNSMPFPDQLERAARTVTATCTRVSRESIIVEDPDRKGAFRRLTVRERAALQGFPITYQFYGGTHAQKLKMVGNAMPPLLAYLVGNALKGTPKERLSSPNLRVPTRPVVDPPKTCPDVVAKKFPPTRTFRFAIPNLHLKSGVRFELANSHSCNRTDWAISFLFGSSVSIYRLSLDANAKADVLASLPEERIDVVTPKLLCLSRYLGSCDITRMQAVWSHRGPGGTRPFDLLDELGRIAGELEGSLATCPAHILEGAIKVVLDRQFGSKSEALTGVSKLLRHAPKVCAGILTGATANGELQQTAAQTKPAVLGVRKGVERGAA